MKSNTLARKPKPQFPVYLIDSMGSEDTETALTDQKDIDLFRILFKADQLVDQYNAYEYAQNAFEYLDARKMPASHFISFIRAINRIAAHSLMKMKGGLNQAGEYTQNGITITKETNLPGREYQNIHVYSDHNYKIIEDRDGTADAKAYKEFMGITGTFWEELSHKDPKMSIDEKLQMCLSKYKDHTGYPVFQRMCYFIDPKSIPENMQKFADELINKIAANADPLMCATFTLYHLIKKHGFMHGNRRSTRIVMNWLLMSLGEEPILIPYQRVGDYYSAIERCSDNNLDPLYQLMKEFSAISHSVEDKKPLLPHLAEEKLTTSSQKKEGSPIFPIFISKDDGIITIFHDHYTFTNKSDKTQIINADFYLQLANRFIGSHPQVGSYFYEQRTRFKPLRNIINICPGETTYFSDQHAVQNDLLIRLQVDRYAIFFRDSKGNVFVIHHDRMTDYDFANTAKSLMIGQFTVDIFKHGGNNSNESDIPIYSEIKKLLGNLDIKNSKGETNYRTSSSGEVLLTQGIFFAPTQDNVKSILPYNNCQLKDIKNPLRHSIIMEGVIPSELRMHHRHILQATVINRIPPTHVYHNGWTGTHPELPKESIAFQKAVELCGKDINKSTKLIQKTVLAARGSAPKSFCTNVQGLLTICEQAYPRNLYLRLGGLFKEMKLEIPNEEKMSAKEAQQKLNQVTLLIAEYTQGEEENSLYTMHNMSKEDRIKMSATSK